jgi:hypothetical protein
MYACLESTMVPSRSKSIPFAFNFVFFIGFSPSLKRFLALFASIGFYLRLIV